MPFTCTNGQLFFCGCLHETGAEANDCGARKSQVRVFEDLPSDWVVIEVDPDFYRRRWKEASGL